MNYSKEKQEKRYIELKLIGCIDDKSKLAEEYNIDKNTIKTIAAVVQKEEGISQEEYAVYQDKYNAKIQVIKSLFTKDREDGFKNIVKFHDWYLEHDKIGTCCYCGVHKDDANGNEVFDNSKRGRGQIFEVERLITFPDEKNVYTPNNCRLVCHICNNAKSDFLSVSDFKFIAEGICRFWENKLGKKIDFPNDIYEKFKGV